MRKDIVRIGRLLPRAAWLLTCRDQARGSSIVGRFTCRAMSRPLGLHASRPARRGGHCGPGDAAPLSRAVQEGNLNGFRPVERMPPEGQVWRGEPNANAVSVLSSDKVSRTVCFALIGQVLDGQPLTAGRFSLPRAPKMARACRFFPNVGTAPSQEESQQAGRMASWQAPPTEASPRRLCGATDGTPVHEQGGWHEVKAASFHWDDENGQRHVRYRWPPTWKSRATDWRTTASGRGGWRSARDKLRPPASKHVVGVRLKRNGMRWSRLGAQATLSLPAARLNGHWHQLWSLHPPARAA
jgi:hypothetical protein